jgi:hypothetical protein
MEQDDLLRFVAGQLATLGIPYFVTGSIAAAFYDEYRMTNDVDVVVDLRPNHIDALLALFPPDQFYLDRTTIVDAVQNRFQFNLIDRQSFSKVDFIIHGGRSHDREQLRRARHTRHPAGVNIAYIAPQRPHPQKTSVPHRQQLRKTSPRRRLHPQSLLSLPRLPIPRKLVRLAQHPPCLAQSPPTRRSITLE